MQNSVKIYEFNWNEKKDEKSFVKNQRENAMEKPESINFHSNIYSRKTFFSFYSLCVFLAFK